MYITCDYYLLVQLGAGGFVLFATDEQIRIMGESSALHMDGTFKTCPKPFSQVHCSKILNTA
jgi:hypothetical protein